VDKIRIRLGQGTIVTIDESGEDKSSPQHLRIGIKKFILAMQR
jgi:hypothetical protein